MALLKNLKANGTQDCRRKYNLEEFNCVDFVIWFVKAPGHRRTLPDPQTDWPHGLKGAAPGPFGAALAK